MRTVLVDSSFLYALFDHSDKYHPIARDYARSIRSTQVVPDVVPTEVAHMLKRIGEPAVLTFMDALSQAHYQLEALQPADIQRARQIKIAYPAARLDFVDCCLMAISERLKITHVCTFDRRDFSIFRPRHCDYLELIP